MAGLHDIHAGFLPLMDAAILIAAKEFGFAEAAGVKLHLHRETSWANIRDRMAVSHFDVAHMLAPMPVAAALELTPMPMDLIVPMALGLGGNAVTVSNQLYHEMQDTGLMAGLEAHANGIALREVLTKRKAQGGKRICFGIVHPHSSHNYDLRYWLAGSGIVPERDVDFVVVPPSLMPSALGNGQLDGYCVGEPWNSVAVSGGSGEIITTKSRIWRSSPEKVLAASRKFATTRADALDALMRSLIDAAIWCGNPVNHEQLADILSRSEYVGIGTQMLLNSLSGRLASKDGTEFDSPAFFIPFARAANFPWKSHALWFYSQMVRWGQAEFNEADAKLIESVWRPDIYRRVAEDMGLAVPAANSKVEGALHAGLPVGVGKGELVLGPDGFFDGQSFDPDKLAGYIQAQKADI